MDPNGFVSNYYNTGSSSSNNSGKHPLATHFVLYDDYLPKLQTFFDKIGYHEVIIMTIIITSIC